MTALPGPPPGVGGQLPIAPPVNSGIIPQGYMPTASGTARSVSVYSATGDRKIDDTTRKDNVTAKFQEFMGLLGQIVNLRNANATGANLLASCDDFDVDLKMHSKVAEVSFIDPVTGQSRVELVDLTMPSIVGGTARKALMVAQELQSHMVALNMVSAGGDRIAGDDYDEEYRYGLAPRVGQDGFTASFAKMTGADQTKATLSKKDANLRSNLIFKFFGTSIPQDDEMTLIKNIEIDFTGAEIRFVQQKRMLERAKADLNAQLQTPGGLATMGWQRVRKNLERTGGTAC
jgi:hypothetical protein